MKLNATGLVLALALLGAAVAFYALGSIELAATALGAVVGMFAPSPLKPPA